MSASLGDAPPPFDTIVFDCDSTLSTIEGIDELARRFSDRAPASEIDELARLTNAAMDGLIPLEEVYGRRLEVVRPSRSDLAIIGELYSEHAVPGVFGLVAALLHLKKRVRIVSGGLLPAVLPFALALGLGEGDVDAVEVEFDEAGGYKAFNSASPLARSGGKIEVVRRIRAELQAASVALVGDGATDLEAAAVVERFVAFGGVERRERVFASARVHCATPDFRALCPLLLSPTEIATLAATDEHRDLTTCT